MEQTFLKRWPNNPPLTADLLVRKIYTLLEENIISMTRFRRASSSKTTYRPGSRRQPGPRGPDAIGKTPAWSYGGPEKGGSWRALRSGRSSTITKSGR